jgi:hypothetical protein
MYPRREISFFGKQILLFEGGYFVFIDWRETNERRQRLGPFLTGSFRDVAPGDGRLTDQSPLTSLRKLDANAAQKVRSR